MFEGQYLFSDDVGGISVYSPWFARGGDNAEFTVDIIQATGAKLDIAVLTKKSEDAGDGGSTIASQTNINTAGRTTISSTAGAEELVRYRFTCKADTTDVLGYVLFRMLPIVWWNAVKVST